MPLAGRIVQISWRYSPRMARMSTQAPQPLRVAMLARVVFPYVENHTFYVEHWAHATIWRKQVDGRWKFVIDGAGAKIEGRAKRVPGSAVEKLATSSWGHGAGPARALAEARAAEEHMAALARQDARGAISKYLASRAWLMGSSVEPNGDAEAAKAELSRRPAQLAFHYVGGEASAAGDLVFTYGRAESTDPEVPLTDASYLNVWQRQPSGWRLIFEGLKSRR